MSTTNNTKVRRAGTTHKKKPVEIVRATKDFLPFTCDLSQLFACVECWRAAVQHGKQFVSRECQSVAKGVPLRGLWPQEIPYAHTWLFAATVTRSACRAWGLDYAFYKQHVLPRAADAVQWLFAGHRPGNWITTPETDWHGDGGREIWGMEPSPLCPWRSSATSTSANSTTTPTSLLSSSPTSAPASATSSTTTTTTTTTWTSEEAEHQHKQYKKLLRAAKIEKRRHERVVKREHVRHERKMNEIEGRMHKFKI